MWVVTRCEVEEAWYRVAVQREGDPDPPAYGRRHVWNSAAGIVGKVSRVVSACPHSEGAAYKPQGGEVAACR